MAIALFADLSGILLGWLMGFLSLFLILLILIQRGKGGGLSGALGGPGGQSAFGSKAGDTFTIITVVVAAIWGFTCAFTMWLLGTHAPTSITDSAISAGPGDDDVTTGLVVPPLDGGQAGSISDGIGLSGLGDSGTDDSGTDDSGTVDSGTVDSGTVDSGTEDSGSEDSQGESDEATDEPETEATP